MGWADQIGGLQGWATWVDALVEANNGSSIVLYNQGKDVRLKVGGSLVNGGFCLAVSIMWIVKSARGESFWDWFQPPHQACPNLKNSKQMAGCGEIMTLVKEIMRVEGQKTALGKLAKTKNMEIDKDLYMGLDAWWAPKVSHDSPSLRHKAGDGLRYGSVGGHAVCDLILGTKSGYKLISASGVDGAHAMAARVVGGTIIFMDPNYGEFFFPTAVDFRKFMLEFWKTKYFSKLSDVVTVAAFTDPEMLKFG